MDTVLDYRVCFLIASSSHQHNSLFRTSSCTSNLSSLQMSSGVLVLIYTTGTRGVSMRGRGRRGAASDLQPSKETATLLFQVYSR